MNDENDDNKELLRCLRTDVEEVEKDMNLKRKAKVPVVLKIFSLSLCAAVLLIVTLILTFSFVVNKYVKTFENPQVKILSDGMRADLDSVLSHSFSLLRPLPYNITVPQLAVKAKSAILVDADNGFIVYEKNADKVIPPASLTKLVGMYIAMKDVEAGKIALADVVPLPPQSWAINAPVGSSLMYLGEGQRVTLEELLRGMAVVSGNDAAMAVACYVSGSAVEFVKRMNSEMASLGLTQTKFVEPTGYSEENKTTARELAAFCRVYLEKFPQTIELFHNVRNFTYPQEHNLPVNYVQKNVMAGTLPVTQEPTNRVLMKIQGADGLKTGFINESGYNLALTVCRDETRFISVTLGGIGNNTIEGNFYRLADSELLMNWVFSSFETYKSLENNEFPICVFGGDVNVLNLVPARFSSAFSIPVPKSEEEVRVDVELPKFLQAPVQVGDVLGNLVYSQGDLVLERVPLIADRTVVGCGGLKKFFDNYALKRRFSE
jgi:D-alanyl-D-alanine carboxypeptidase (penicillin-binding protein 5/6)